MNHSTLQQLLPFDLPKAVAEIVVINLAIDSRSVGRGDVFLAIKGESLDGSQFIGAAIAQGAAAVLSQRDDLSEGHVDYELSVPIVNVHQLSTRYGALAKNFYHNPSAYMNVVGITGTNGKTTCAYLLAQVARQLGRDAGSIGTLGVTCNGEQLLDTGMTTPDAMTSQFALAQLRARGVSTVAMEVSSHALAQGRVTDVAFSAAIFTNISHDHLDYHGSMAAYVQAKVKLFNSNNLKFAIINADDAHAPTMQKAAKSGSVTALTFGINNPADVMAKNVVYGLGKTEFDLLSPWGPAHVTTRLTGEFNVANLLAVITALCAQGASFEHVLEQSAMVPPVPGRMQVLHEGTDINVVVDYAHTPDALEKALLALKQLPHNKLWCVFGCGGNRDATKRAPMAKAAERHADQVVVSSDNPRSEAQQKIISEICSGFEKNSFEVEADRKLAIELAVHQAQSGDVVLVAGKGHEDYQVVGDTVLPFDDVAIARGALHQRCIQSGVNAKGGL